MALTGRCSNSLFHPKDIQRIPDISYSLLDHHNGMIRMINYLLHWNEGSNWQAEHQLCVLKIPIMWIYLNLHLIGPSSVWICLCDVYQPNTSYYLDNPTLCIGTETSG